MRMDNIEFLSKAGCRFFALGPFLPEEGIEISLPVKPPNLPAGTARIKVVNAAGTYVGAWKIDVAGSDPDLELELPFSHLRK
jgi:hypothetical protein